MSYEQFSLVLTNARLVLDGVVQDGGIAVQDGRIARILAPSEVPESAQLVRDVRGCNVLPGLIDAHVHFRTPGLTHKETWYTATRAAVAGGITTVVDMPNTQPPLLHTDQIAEKLACIEGQALTDFGFHLGVHPEKLALLESIESDLVMSVKVFLAGHHTAPHIITEQHDLEEIFALAARYHLPVTLHAEDQRVFQVLEHLASLPSPILDYETRHSDTGGVVAVARAIELVRTYGTRTHVLHVASRSQVQLLQAAKQAGLPISFEVTPHHLSLTATDGYRIGSRAKISPAFHNEDDRRALWQAVRAGSVYTIGSDHAPHSSEEKEVPFEEAPPGLPGVQELLPALLTGLATMFPKMTLDERMLLVARLCAQQPAQIYGLSHRKGTLLPGFDADITVVDSQQRWRVQPANLYTQCGWSAYEGWLFIGLPILTVRRGTIVYERRSDGTENFGAPDGAFITPRRAISPLAPV
jgi:dihydroorotase